MTAQRPVSRRRFLAATATAAALAGCSSGDSTTTDEPVTTTRERVDTSTPKDPATPEASPPQATTTAESSVRTDRDIVFRETGGATLALDLYRPAEGGDHPFLVFAHGGGWVGGDKGYRPMFPAMAEAGIAVADVQYRLAQTARYPAAVRDVTAAVKWVRANSDRYGIDAERGALGGYSAGAHLSALVAVAPDHETFQPTDFHPDVSASVDALVGYSGPYDFTVPGAGENPLVSAFFGADASEATLREGSPTTHVDGEDPPAMLVHGTEDGVVPYRSTTVFAGALRDAGLRADVVTGEGASHGMIDNPEWRDRTLPAQRAFLREHLDLV